MDCKNTNEQQWTKESGEWDHLVNMPQMCVIHFDPELRRLSEEEKDALSKLISGSKKYKARSILVGFLLSFLAILLLSLCFVFLAASEAITEDTFPLVTLLILFAWCIITYLSFRMPSRRSKSWVRNLKFKQVVMFISTTINMTPFSPGIINPVKEIHVWEYESGVPVQRTYNVHNNTYLAKDAIEGNLIYMYSNQLQCEKYSSCFFTTK